MCVCILAPPRDAEARPPRRETESQRVLPRPLRTAFPGPSSARPRARRPRAATTRYLRPRPCASGPGAVAPRGLPPPPARPARAAPPRPRPGLLVETFRCISWQIAPVRGVHTLPRVGRYLTGVCPLQTRLGAPAGRASRTPALSAPRRVGRPRAGIAPGRAVFRLPARASARGAPRPPDLWATCEQLRRQDSQQGPSHGCSAHGCSPFTHGRSRRTGGTPGAAVAPNCPPHGEAVAGASRPPSPRSP